MDDDHAATALAALGHPARLRLFRLLVRAEPDGLNIGALGRHLGLAPSTLAHHLGALKGAGLVRQARVGRETINHADTAAMRRLFAHVEADCCAGIGRPDAALSEEGAA
ncbi:MAG: ArsR/SmtB family transcription factor [Paracoccaceae bacterium]